MNTYWQQKLDELLLAVQSQNASQEVLEEFKTMAIQSDKYETILNLMDGDDLRE